MSNVLPEYVVNEYIIPASESSLFNQGHDIKTELKKFYDLEKEPFTESRSPKNIEYIRQFFGRVNGLKYLNIVYVRFTNTLKKHKLFNEFEDIEGVKYYKDIVLKCGNIPYDLMTKVEPISDADRWTKFTATINDNSVHIYMNNSVYPNYLESCVIMNQVYSNSPVNLDSIIKTISNEVAKLKEGNFKNKIMIVVGGIKTNIQKANAMIPRTNEFGTGYKKDEDEKFEDENEFAQNSGDDDEEDEHDDSLNKTQNDSYFEKNKQDGPTGTIKKKAEMGQYRQEYVDQRLNKIKNKLDADENLLDLSNIDTNQMLIDERKDDNEEDNKEYADLFGERKEDGEEEYKGEEEGEKSVNISRSRPESGGAEYDGDRDMVSNIENIKRTASQTASDNTKINQVVTFSKQYLRQANSKAKGPPNNNVMYWEYSTSKLVLAPVILDNYLDFDTSVSDLENVGKENQSIGQLLAITLLRGYKHLNSASFLQTTYQSSNDLTYGGIRGHSSSIFKLKSFYESIQAIRACSVIKQKVKSHMLAKVDSDSTSKANIFLNRYIFKADPNFVNTVISYNDATDDEIIGDIVLYLSIEKDSSPSGFIFVENSRQRAYIKFLVTIFKKSLSETDEVSFGEYIEGIYNDSYWNGFADQLYEGNIYGTYFEYDILKIGIIGAKYPRTKGFIKASGNFADYVRKTNVQCVSFYLWICTHKFGYNGIGLKKMRGISRKVAAQYGLSQYSNNPENELSLLTNTLSLSDGPSGKNSKFEGEVQKLNPKSGSDRTMFDQIVKSNYGVARPAFKTLYGLIDKLSSGYMSNTSIEGENALNKMLKEEIPLKELKVMKGPWSLMTLKRHFLKYGIYIFYSSLHLDSTSSKERKWGVRVGNGTLFTPVPRYDFGMGSISILKIGKKPEEYKKEWEDFISNITEERKKGKEASFTTGTKDIDLFKSGDDAQLTVKNKKDGIKNGQIIQIKLDSLKSPQDIFKKLPKIKMMVQDHIDDIKGIVEFTKNPDFNFQGLRQAEEKRYLAFLWDDLSCSNERMIANRLFEQKLQDRIKTLSGLNALKELAVYSKSMGSVTQRGNAYQVQVSDASNIVETLKKSLVKGTDMSNSYLKKSKEEEVLLENELQAENILTDIVNPIVSELKKENQVAKATNLVKEIETGTKVINPVFRNRGPILADTEPVYQKMMSKYKNIESSQISINTSRALLLALVKMFPQLEKLQDNIPQLAAELKKINSELEGDPTPTNLRKSKIVLSALDKLDNLTDIKLSQYPIYSKGDLLPTMVKEKKIKEKTKAGMRRAKNTAYLNEE